MAYWGMDVYAYPGDTTMKAWKNNSDLKWTGFYLAPTLNHSDTSFMSQRSSLVNQGWNIVPIYVGHQAPSTYFTKAKGTADAHAAEQLAKNAGFPSGTCIYLDVEKGGTLESDQITYIKAFITELSANTMYDPGVYCSYTTADQIQSAISSIYAKYWVWHLKKWTGTPVTDKAPSPSTSGTSYAESWQLIQNTSKTIGGHKIDPVDFSSSSSANPA
jgi:hypothetical protein